MSDLHIETPEEGAELVHRAIEVGDLILTAKDAAEMVGLLEGVGGAGAAALETAAVLGPILALLAGLYALLKADETEENLAGARGFAYGFVWGVLDKGTPTATCGGANELFPDRVKSEQEHFDKGVQEGASKAGDQKLKNHCLLWMAKHKDESGDQLLRDIFTDSATHLDISASIASELAGNLSTGTPVC
jgi:hypothetical protein